MTYDKVEFTLTPEEFLQELGINYKRREDWLGLKWCLFCFGGESKQVHTFAIHAIDGNYSCLRTKCGVKGSFWNLMLHYGYNPVNYIKRTDKSFKPKPEKREKTRFIYGKKNR